MNTAYAWPNLILCSRRTKGAMSKANIKARMMGTSTSLPKYSNASTTPVAMTISDRWLAEAVGCGSGVKGMLVMSDGVAFSARACHACGALWAAMHPWAWRKTAVLLGML